MRMSKVRSVATSAVFAAMLGLSAVPSHAATIDINGGSSWGGWTLQGTSQTAGIWASGATTGPYNVYTSVFSYSTNTVTGSPTGGGGTVGGFGAGFVNGDKILGIGVDAGSLTIPTTVYTLKLDFGNNSYQAASSVGAGDGKVSSSTYANAGDVNIQNNSGSFQANQLTVFTPAVGLTAESSNAANGLIRPFASFRQGNSYQIFVDLDQLASWAVASAAVLSVSPDAVGPIGSSLTFDLAPGFSTTNVVIGNLSLATSEVPLPAALPLFASGLGALGLLGWRRKKKAGALAAA
jgi:hypothetical protein